MLFTHRYFISSKEQTGKTQARDDGRMTETCVAITSEEKKIYCVDGPLIALLIIHTQQEASPHQPQCVSTTITTINDYHSNHNS
jgi:hypothetical protein